MGDGGREVYDMEAGGEGVVAEYEKKGLLLKSPNSNETFSTESQKLIKTYYFFPNEYCYFILQSSLNRQTIERVPKLGSFAQH